MNLTRDFYHYIRTVSMNEPNEFRLLEEKYGKTSESKP
jgi:hypothetical protein